MRLSYANVMATGAMFVALGGTSYAAVKLSRDSVGSREVKDRSLQRQDLAANAIPPTVPGARGPRGAQGSTGPRGPSDIIVRKRESNAVVGFAANASVEVASMALPAGDWLVQADTLGEYFPNVSPHADVFRCVLIVGGVAGRDKEQFLGNQTGAEHMGEFGLQQVVRVSSSTRVALACRHDADLPSGGSMAAFRHTTLWATQGASVDDDNVSG